MVFCSWCSLSTTGSPDGRGRLPTARPAVYFNTNVGEGRHRHRVRHRTQQSSGGVCAATERLWTVIHAKDRALGRDEQKPQNSRPRADSSAGIPTQWKTGVLFYKGYTGTQDNTLRKDYFLVTKLVSAATNLGTWSATATALGEIWAIISFGSWDMRSGRYFAPYYSGSLVVLRKIGPRCFLCFFATIITERKKEDINCGTLLHHEHSRFRNVFVLLFLGCI